ncbi:MAG: FKBP-type peptidyl-prolyl cis-trans isomerase [Saprospiraceae bacterium]|nr:FKBP-type peptidyl-prolyl cis-trans isomerase [Saprospiraceae bacterium]
MKFQLTILALFIMLVSCKKKESTTLSGFKYSIINDEAGANLKEGDYVYFRYIVKVNDSLVFNSSSQSSDIKFKLPKQEKKELKNAQPIVEVFYYLSKGDSAIVMQTIDDEIRKQIGIPDAKELVFHVVVTDIKDQAGYEADMKVEQEAINSKRAAGAAAVASIQENVKKTLADYKSGSNKSQIITTASGLKYIVHETGTGPKAQPGQVVSANYYGTLMDGTMFDNSFERGQDFQFPLGQGQVIKGWDEAFGLLPVGSKATLFIPSELGYGAAGSPPAIPENAELLFYVELLGVK